MAQGLGCWRALAALKWRRQGGRASARPPLRFALAWSRSGGGTCRLASALLGHGVLDEVAGLGGDDQLLDALADAHPDAAAQADARIVLAPGHAVAPLGRVAEGDAGPRVGVAVAIEQRAMLAPDPGEARGAVQVVLKSPNPLFYL